MSTSRTRALRPPLPSSGCSRPWTTFGEGPTEVPEGYFTDTKRSAFTGQDFRFTRRDDALYAICLGWPEGEAVVKSLGSAAGQVASVGLLGAEGLLSFRQDAAGLHIALPDARPCDYAYTFKIRLR